MRGRKKGELALAVLELLGKTALATATIIVAILDSPYGASRSRIERSIREIERGSDARSSEELAERQLRDLLYRLKRDGIIKKTEGRNKWSATIKGKKLLKFLRGDKDKNLPRRRYSKTPDNELKIITFDIPEKHRRKRDWLRQALNNLGFMMLQKSVWAGKCAVPEELLVDLKELKLLPYVEIFAVTKTGSLKPVTFNSRS